MCWDFGMESNDKVRDFSAVNAMGFIYIFKELYIGL